MAVKCSDPITGAPCRHTDFVYEGCVCLHCRADQEGGLLHVQNLQIDEPVDDYLLDFLNALYELEE
jgi:hypothetical protein